MSEMTGTVKLELTDMEHSVLTTIIEFHVDDWGEGQEECQFYDREAFFSLCKKFGVNTFEEN